MYDQSEQSLGVHCESQGCGVKTRKDLCVEIQSVTDMIWQYANISILKLYNYWFLSFRNVGTY